MFYTRENIIKEEVNKQSKKDEDYLDFLHEGIKEKIEEVPQKYNINYFMDWIYNKCIEWRNILYGWRYKI